MIRMAKINIENAKCGQENRATETFIHSLRKCQNATTMLENSLAVPYKTEYKFTICPSNPIPRYLFILEKQKCMFTQHLNTNVYSTSIPNCQKLERKQVSFKG